MTFRCVDKAQMWLAKCNENNKELQECISEIAVLLAAVKESAEGDVATMYVQFSTRANIAATELFNAVSSVANDVNTVIDTYKWLTQQIEQSIINMMAQGVQ